MAKTDLQNVILFQIDRTSKVAKQYSQRELDALQLDITVDQWVLLKIVENKGKLSQRELAEVSFRDPASITRTLNLLERKDMLLREAIPNNKRQYQIDLTAYGRAFIKKHMTMVQRHHKQSLKGFSSKEITLLDSMLRRIQDNLK